MPPLSRRSFLSSVAAAGVAAPLARDRLTGIDLPAAKPLKILVLGGTAFLGPPFVRAALANGHTVTLFNRGKTNPGLFAELEQLRGDREKGDLASLAGREFDVVVDTSGYVPAHVEATARLFAEKAKHYQFVSSVSVYGAFGERADTVDETSDVGEVADDKVEGIGTIRQAMPFYGPLKARCEAAAEAVMPGRVSRIRPGLIVGPGDRSDRFTWWPVRIDRGGEVLAPGDPDGAVQFIDVRDLAEWMLHCLEQDVFGVYNAVGFAGRVSMAEMLAACKCATAAPVTLTFASEEFLAENQVRAWSELPVWIPREARSVIANARAIGKGLQFRPIADTVRDTLHWARTERGDKPFASTGLRPEREQELLANWHRTTK
ncbi:MAG TPA: NAD-dependent epimerase/dehydratase family protein [Planctomycetota bacterium]|nr:NAD-dependent epimerase/dehydratase family protein [Planctomycetota bacterium]